MKNKIFFSTATILVLTSIILFIICYKKSKNINDIRFNKATSSIVYTQYKINMDSLLSTYKALKKKNEVSIFLDSLENHTEKLKNKYVAEKKCKKNIILKKKYFDFMKTKAGKIKKDNPEWSTLDCSRLANNYLWVGMHIDMVKYTRGNPDDINIRRNLFTDEYEYVWRNEGISHFYTKKDGTVILYN